MGSRLAVCAFVLAVGLTGCGKTQPPDSPSGSGALQVTSSERLMWGQSIGAGESIFLFQFAALVDGVLADLTGSDCFPSGELLYDCSSPMPAMSAGPHVLQLVAIYGSLKSPPSTPPLSIVLVASTSNSSGASVGATAGTAAAETRTTTADGVRLLVAAPVTGLVDVTDLAPTPDGGMLVAERAGRIRVYRAGAIQAAPAATLGDALSAGGELLAIAADPSFATNRQVYAVHTAAASIGATAAAGALEFRVTRLTLADEGVGAEMTLLSGIPASSGRPAAALRFGPDGKLYAAFDDAGSETAPWDLASFNGKVLRLNTDGSTPPDQPAATPVFASGLRSPRQLAWSADGTVLWIVQGWSDGTERMTPVKIERPHRAEPRAPYSLPVPFGIGGASVYSASLIPQFQGDMFLGGADAGCLLRLRFDPTDPLTVASTEHVLENRPGIRAVAVGRDGAIYVATAESLLRLAPAASREPASKTPHLDGR